MEITNEALSWDSEDVVLWRTFLATRTGSRLLPKLAESTPPLLESGKKHILLVRSGKVLGFQESIRALLALAVIQPAAPVETSAYPALEDDSSWQDGQKLTEPKTL